MKKLLALALVAAMVLSLAACSGGSGSGTDSGSGGSAQPQTEAAEPGNSDAGTDTDAGSGSGSQDAPASSAHAYPNCNEDGSINLDTVGHYDPYYDYSQNERYQVVYIAAASGSLYQEAAAAYEQWCSLMNLEWMGFSSSEGDSDKYMTLLQQALDSGYDIFILDPDATTWNSLLPLLNEYPDIAWMSMMSPARDGSEGEGVPVGGNLLHPFAGFDHYNAGWEQMEKLFQWMEENYPDADWSEVGCLAMDYSISPVLHQREIANADYWAQNAPAEAQDNFFQADCAASGISVQAGIDVAGPIVSTNDQIKYWLVSGNVDDWAQGAATVIESAGLGETSCVTTFGGTALQAQWDAGTQNCWRYSLSTAEALYAEPLLGACYAYLQGWATPDTIWPSWINWNDHGLDDHMYASRRLPITWLDYDNYQYFYEWVDLYTGTDFYHYDVDVDLDYFSPLVSEIPPEYAAA